MLTQEAINEFIELYRQDYNIVLSEEEATERATLLFSALEVLIKPDLTKCPNEVHHDT